MRKKKALSFGSDIYRQQYYFLSGWDREQVEETLNVDTGASGGVTFESGGTVYIWVEDIGSAHGVSDLVHECVHAANFTLGSRGVVVSAEDDEAQAYLVGWIFQHCYQASKRSLLKIKK